MTDISQADWLNSQPDLSKMSFEEAKAGYKLVQPGQGKGLRENAYLKARGLPLKPKGSKPGTKSAKDPWAALDDAVAGLNSLVVQAKAGSAIESLSTAQILAVYTARLLEDAQKKV